MIEARLRVAGIYKANLHDVFQLGRAISGSSNPSMHQSVRAQDEQNRLGACARRDGEGAKYLRPA